jgi:hypothetical protein
LKFNVYQETRECATSETIRTEQIEQLDLQLAKFVSDNMRHDGNPDGADPGESWSRLP